MKRRLLLGLAVVLVLVAAAGTALVLTTFQPRYDEEMGNSLYNAGLAQEALARGDAQEARLRTLSAQSTLDSAQEIGTAITVTWAVVGVALLGAVAIGVGLRRTRSRSSSSSTPIPGPAGALGGTDAGAATTFMPAMASGPPQPPAPPPAPPRPQVPPPGPPTVPPGWYLDARGTQRWFDGRGWTHHVR
ncbi:hypothetical protein Acsp06_25910 [Actinomycetospora sp. NBRC 106375]|uniref:DUF2510 domain-containing protein n=1 Tax=Actinomycetospora sp. NBRC 106375 TaxID=3032207 RepID=UPI0024A54A73|nr:DUF2510 domain-containing protein [Actinomycetospora sp. NBRC 106375]GLZ46406.1 hypothetical protein Acsp06_25910 [Actinomycetospora sp. NBRC 106375]